MHYHNIYRFMLVGRLFFIFTYSMMNKKLSLIALLGLVASPLMLNGNVTFAAEDATATDKATEKVTEEVVDETLTDDGTALDGAETVSADEAGDGELASDEAGDEAITDAFETTEDTHALMNVLQQSNILILHHKRLRQLTKLVMLQVHRALVTNHCRQCLIQQAIWLNKCLYLKN